MIPITYAITVCNEIEEITRLIDFLLIRIRESDEILVQYDTDTVTDQVTNYLNVIEALHKNIKVISFPLNGDFATFKNNLTSYASGQFIFQIDADEIPSEYLIDNLPEILETNSEVDLYFLPRVNIVDGITDEHVKKWSWTVNDEGWINFPDLQNRIYKKTDTIRWEGKVHEVLSGYNTFSILPTEPLYSLLHHKQIDRQERQNELYSKIQSKL